MDLLPVTTVSSSYNVPMSIWYTGLSAMTSAVDIPQDRNVSGINTEHKLPNCTISSKSESLDSTSFSNSTSSSGIGSGSSIDTVTRLGYVLGDTEGFLVSEGGIGSTVMAITVSSPG